MRPRRHHSLILIAAMLACGCKPYRIEYRERPLSLPGAGQKTGPEKIVRPDGTIVYYTDRQLTGPLQEDDEKAQDAKPFEVREEQDDGTIVLRAALPEHVLSNTFTCLVNQEYELLWDQMLAAETRQAYEQQGLTRDDFVRFFKENRRELAATVNRILHGLPANQVVIDRLGGGTLRYRLIPKVAEHFKFKSVVVMSEPGGMRLVLIR
jgi:hypothetical protein